MRTGFIAILGRPNVGKSTLLNAMLGEKIAIVSNKPQTTRTRITGILTKGEDQFVFLDTPGLIKAKNRLGDFMVRTVSDTIGEVDACIVVVEAGMKPRSHRSCRNSEDISKKASGNPCHQQDRQGRRGGCRKKHT